MTRFTSGHARFLAVGLGGATAIGLIAWAGADAIGEAVLRAGWILPGLVALHALQLLLSAVAWREAAGGGGPALAAWASIRWIREAVNSMLPVAQVGGLVVGVRLLGHRGVASATGGAGTTLDTIVEALAQLLFTLIGVVALAAISTDARWLARLGELVLVLAACGAGVLLARRAGAVGVGKRLILRLGARFPALPIGPLRRLSDEVLRLRTHHTALWRAGLWHMLAWLLGVVETWGTLAALGWPVSLPAALVIESLGTAARSAGFAVPGALGVQEGGLVLVGGLLGVPPDAAVALSVMKRARELVVGLSGLLAWQWIEGRRLARRPAQ